MGGKFDTLRENIISILADRPEIRYNDIFNPCANSSDVRFSIFIPLYRKEGYAGYGK